MKHFCQTRCVVWFLTLFTYLIISVTIVKLTESSDKSAISDHDSSSNDFFDDADIAPFAGERVVHLDLKGAPPSIKYLEDIFPLFRVLGITSILIEYEDVFPYSSKFMPAVNAYSKKDIVDLLKAAAKNNLNVIPLVQTFGHLEFLLKYGNFSHLREVDQYPQSICPSRNGTFSLITDLLDEVIGAHPNIRYIHIGSDEVFQLGICEKCQLKMASKQWNTDELFLDHVTRIAKFVRSKYPGIIPLMWDDQLRSISLDKLKNFDIGTLVEPVVWYYYPVISLPAELWKKYAQIFPAIWVASSFKGATGPDGILSNISYHVKNQKSWMLVMSEYKSLIKFKGIVITGWQRYDHFAVLCELFPVGVPTLVSVALVLDGSSSTRGITSYKIRNVLACGTKWELNDSCKFPGADVRYSIVKFSRLKTDIDNVFASSPVRGWFTAFNLKTKYFNALLADELLYKINDCQNALTRSKSVLHRALSTVYDNYTVSEWIETYVSPYASKLSGMAETLHNLSKVRVWKPRYADLM